MATPKSGQPVVLSPAARQDIENLLLWSLDKFGADAAQRYRKLLIQALRDIEADPMRPGSRTRPELHKDARIYFLSSSRASVEGKRVKAPRHFLLYRVRSNRLEVGRILHDSRDLARHLQAGFRA
jgi:toxin ParE1/3/4